MPRTALFVFGMLLGVFAPGLVLAQSTSTNYILWDSSVNAGGGKSTSTGYVTFGTVTDVAGAPMESSSFQAVTGFEAIYEDPSISFTISPTIVTLVPNPLTPASVSSGTTTLTVSTNGDFGYVLTAMDMAAAQNQAGEPLADVSDGAVTAGSEEFGIAVSGVDAAFGTDEPLTGSPLTIAAKATWGADRATVVTFKAAISATTHSGTYAGTALFIATARY